MRHIKVIALAGMLSLVLAGCRDREEAAPEELNNSANAAEPVNASTPAPPPPPPANVAEAPAPSMEFSDDQQMRDDADATGLTARLPREGDAPAAPANPPAQAPTQ